MGRDIDAQTSNSVANPFYKNPYLKYLTIGSTVTVVNDNSFNGCCNIDTLTMKGAPPTINNCNAFTCVDRDIPVVIFCDKYLTTYQSTKCWEDFTNYLCDIFIPVTDIIIDVPTTITAGTQQLLSGTVVPDNATNQNITWSIEDAGTTEAIITGSNILNTTAAGTVTIKATVANGTREDFAKIFSIMVIGTDISDILLSKVVIYPNPTTGELRIENEEIKINGIEIFDVYGRKVLSHFANHLPPTAIDVSYLSAGVYFVKIHTEKGEVVRKVVKE